jgi:outer membrane protein assembly factor BamB
MKKPTFLIRRCFSPLTGITLLLTLAMNLARAETEAPAGGAKAVAPTMTTSSSDKPTAASIASATLLRGGLMVHAGARDAVLAIEMTKVGAWIVAVIPADAKAAEAIRSAVVQAGLAGQITVMSGLTAQGLPFATNAVSALVVEGGYEAAETERQRVLSPGGVLLAETGGAWKRSSKARPKEMDVWAQWHGDATQNDGNQDSLVGQPRSLQWTGGTAVSTDHGVRTNGRITVNQERSAAGRGPMRIVGRDAFNGARLWEIEGTISSQYAFLMDADRVYLHLESDEPSPMVALDIRTGKQLVAYDAGFKAKNLDMKGRSSKAEGSRKWPWPQALILDGVLVQRFGQSLYALDAGTGRLLWKQELTGDDLFGYIAAKDGLLVVSEGPGFGTSNAYIAGFSRMGLSRVVARDLKTGATRWTWDWSGPKRDDVAEVSHIAIGPGQVGISAVQKAPAGTKMPNGETIRGWGYLIQLDLKTGKQNWIYEHLERYNQGWMAPGLSGHNYFRTYFHDGRQYMVEFSKPRPYDPATGKLTTPEWSYNFRCHPGRTTPELAIGSLFVGSFTDDRYYFCETSRSPCDIGTFPANGLIYQTSNSCPCIAWLPGDNAFSSVAPPAPITATRLEKGTASPAPAPAGAWPAPDAWPMHMRDSLRSNWTETRLAAAPKIAWTKKVDTASKVTGMVAQEWAGQLMKAGPLGGPSHAEGAIILPLPDQQAVVCLDPKTGAERWRTQVEGRVDSAPTIYRGLVLFGTHMGWVYALNRDTGALVWRFLAAPAARNILANGQVESSWPVFGTVSIIDDTLWVAAGREIAMDDGYWWWALDPITGAVKKELKVGFSGEWMHESTAPKDAKGRVDYNAGRLGCAATPLTSDGQILFMQSYGIDTKTGEKVPAVLDSDWYKPGPRAIRPGMYGIQNSGDQVVGARTGVANCLLDRKAKAFAWKGDRFIGLGAGGKGRYDKSDEITMFEALPNGDSKTGFSKEIWKVATPTNGRRVLDANAIGVATDVVVYVHGSTVFAVSLQDGKELWNLPLPSRGIYSGMSIAEGQVTVVCEDGSVVGIR